MNSPKPTPRSFTRWLIVSLLAVGCVISVVLILKDEPPPDLSDIVVPQASVRDKDNAFLALKKLADDFDAARSRNPAYDRVTEAEDNDRRPNAADLAVRHAAMAALIPKLHDALALPGNAVPRPSNILDVAKEASPTSLRTLVRDLVRDASIQAGIDPRSSMQEMELGLRAADRVEKAQGTLVTWLTSASMRLMVLDTVPGVAGAPGFDERYLAHFQTLLRTYRPDSRALSTALRVELESYYNSGEIFTRDAKGLRSYVSSGGGSASAWRDRLLLLLYDHNQTTRWMAEDYRKISSTLDAPQAALPPATPTLRPEYWFWRIPYPHNHTGRILPLTINNIAPQLITTSRRERALHLATETWIALLRYKRAQAKLPASLDELVPTYLDAVPADPFDGAPLRYDASLRAVWSIGPEGTYTPPADTPADGDGREIDLRVPLPAPQSP